MLVTPDPLTPHEAALAGLLHDIGKLAQRAHMNEAPLRAAYATAGRDVDGTAAAILPTFDGRQTHRHALWSDFFFVKAEASGARWPAGVDGAKMQGVAVRHHNPQPNNPADWIIAEADRLASGLERKPRDEAQDMGTGIRRTELLALLPSMRLENLSSTPAPARLAHAAAALTAGSIVPRPPEPDAQPARITALWEEWQSGFGRIASHPEAADNFEMALLALSERLLWAVPSSTIDQPDVSLHDHARAVAAIGAALCAWHRHGSWDVAAVRDRRVPKFRLVALDLSGIQDALFRLASQKGAARILRARSFLMAETVSAALLALRDRLGLPASCVLLNAGGKAELLVPALPDLDAHLNAASAELDDWMARQWQGDLSVVLAAGAPFAATAFQDRGKGWPAVRADLVTELDAAKRQPFRAWKSISGFAGTGVISAPFGADGPCASCGVRPATMDTKQDSTPRCHVCDGAFRLGQRLPRAEGFALAQPGPQAVTALPGPWALLPWRARGTDVRLSIIFDEDASDQGAHIARTRAHVPLIQDPADPRYRHAGLEVDEEAEAGDLMTFGHIAAHALEKGEHGGFTGRALLGVVKADVDRLGQIFARGFGDDTSPARIAQLSRLMDAYFSQRLPMLLREEFPSTYTVYAGGDDLLLIAPWRNALPLAARLRADFAAFAGGNPHLSLSAGVAFVHSRHPLALAAEQAEIALVRAKDEGRDRLGVLDRTLTWGELERTLRLAHDVNSAVRGCVLPPSVLHRMRRFAADRALAEKGDAAAARWNHVWRYHEVRFLDRSSDVHRADLAALLLRCLPPPAHPQPADAELAMAFALWRNR